MIKMKIVTGGTYYFHASVKQTEKFSNKIVTIREAGSLVSACITEEGQTFAAFNSELSLMPSED
jgi:hypothetical protein